LGIHIEQPLGQVEIRDLMGAALGGSEPQTRPWVTTRSGKHVFQYLGTLSRPRQIGFVGAEGRTIYDFRSNRVRFGDGAWQHPEAVAGAEAARFVELVRLWERMMSAKGGTHGFRAE
jgi:hypothetical protein